MGPDSVRDTLQHLENSLDYARHLGFDEPIDYERFRTIFENLCHSEVMLKRNVNTSKIFMSVGPGDALIVNSTDPMPVIAKEPPAARGDLDLVQIDMRTSIEGNTFREQNSSFSSVSSSHHSVEEGKRRRALFILAYSSHKAKPCGCVIVERIRC